MFDPLDAEFFRILTGSYHHLTGRPLVAPGQGARWLYSEAPFAVLAHDAAEDPRFTYANCAALACFEYAAEEIIGLPSRLSAEPQEREERQRMLEAVTRDGFVPDYRGIRIAKSGRRFWIEDGIVWQLIDETGAIHGQAALFSKWRDV